MLSASLNKTCPSFLRSAGNSAQGEGWASWRGHRRVRVGLHGSHGRPRQHGAQWSSRSLRSAQHRRPDHLHQRHQPGGPAPVGLSEPDQGRAFSTRISRIGLSEPDQGRAFRTRISGIGLPLSACQNQIKVELLVPELVVSACQNQIKVELLVPELVVLACPCQPVRTRSR